ncbi:hypothetical protein O7634_28725 [Micromonospora sp. WMMD1120]|uniref:hypothetical protein n=1 Tax=Micromonospora sp. WMMD1120 TaxID=3016106 RepID=UPI00241726D8|nr:hypothetical protein [Micromonospora sp. WMMD1120]MDG4810759.1 hypothetical protein [Micromonospora sp. WMMD1120]
MEIAVVWVPADLEPPEPAVAMCVAHVRRHAYRSAGVIRAPWETVEQMMVDGEVDVVVIADRGHLPPDRSPRIEVAGTPDVEAGEVAGTPLG